MYYFYYYSNHYRCTARAGNSIGFQLCRQFCKLEYDICNDRDSWDASHADDDSDYHSHRHNDKNNAIISDNYNCTISLSQRFCYVKKTQLIDLW